MLVLLAVDGVISAVLGAVFIQVRLGPVPFPVSALISGLVNALLVWAGLQWTSSLRVAALPAVDLPSHVGGDDAERPGRRCDVRRSGF